MQYIPIQYLKKNKIVINEFLPHTLKFLFLYLSNLKSQTLGISNYDFY